MPTVHRYGHTRKVHQLVQRRGKWGSRLTDENALYDMVMRYSARRSLYRFTEAYPWQANAHYSMAANL
ncbi:hypothetical protein V8Z79_06055 [Pantoea dispersa]|uniref:hypothetical protein n=1 Tax=Pantoea dispersa TaxID=59814 RepID=UPI0030D1AF9B